MELGITNLNIGLKSLIIRLSSEDNVSNLILYIVGKPELGCIPVGHTLCKDLKVISVALLHGNFRQLESVIDVAL